VELKVQKDKWNGRNKAEEREEIRKKIKKTHSGNARTCTIERRIPSYKSCSRA
jgi:hypothetical protein